MKPARKYTGFRDRNGKKIFEGDCLKWPDDKDFSDFLVDKGEVYIYEKVAYVTIVYDYMPIELEDCNPEKSEIRKKVVKKVAYPDNLK